MMKRDIWKTALLGALILTLAFSGCPTETGSGGGDPLLDVTAPGPVSGVYGYYDKSGRRIVLIWDDPADEDLAEIRISWSGGITSAKKKTGTAAIGGIAENRNGDGYALSLKAVDIAGNESDPVELTVKTDITRSMIHVPGGIVSGDHGFGASDAIYSRPITVTPFLIGATEVTYELWSEVYQWAVSAERGDKQYTFARPGSGGGESLNSVFTDKKYHPVTNVGWRDALVWCNAYSEKAGKTPAYYEAGTTTVLRTAEGDGTAAGSGKAELADIKEGANGYRLPNAVEWEYAARGGIPSLDSTAPWNYPYPGSFVTNGTDVAWHLSNSDSRTHEPAEKAANTLGIYDMAGNVAELLDWATHTTGNLVHRRGGS
ncbi:MAG: SUMF1/EgtB/PvdO family nonheme iron enzyme [Spirochaetaceae bacterium]|jgi:formylglycine-generating enzyme required for sulfatase activity|nr:SUMF1/EgtB/PvdO family nonheme iron enzyme [Spirochaetaceae bacterium]